MALDLALTGLSQRYKSYLSRSHIHSCQHKTDLQTAQQEIKQLKIQLHNETKKCRAFKKTVEVLSQKREEDKARLDLWRSKLKEMTGAASKNIMDSTEFQLANSTPVLQNSSFDEDSAVAGDSNKPDSLSPRLSSFSETNTGLSTKPPNHIHSSTSNVTKDTTSDTNINTRNSDFSSGDVTVSEFQLTTPSHTLINESERLVQFKNTPIFYSPPQVNGASLHPIEDSNASSSVIHTPNTNDTKHLSPTTDNHEEKQDDDDTPVEDSQKSSGLCTPPNLEKASKDLDICSSATTSFPTKIGSSSNFRFHDRPNLISSPLKNTVIYELDEYDRNAGVMITESIDMGKSMRNYGSFNMDSSQSYNQDSNNVDASNSKNTIPEPDCASAKEQSDVVDEPNQLVLNRKRQITLDSFHQSNTDEAFEQKRKRRKSREVEAGPFLMQETIPNMFTDDENDNYNDYNHCQSAHDYDDRYPRQEMDVISLDSPTKSKSVCRQNFEKKDASALQTKSLNTENITSKQGKESESIYSNRYPISKRPESLNTKRSKLLNTTDSSNLSNLATSVNQAAPKSVSSKKVYELNFSDIDEDLKKPFSDSSSKPSTRRKSTGSKSYSTSTESLVRIQGPFVSNATIKPKPDSRNTKSRKSLGAIGSKFSSGFASDDDRDTKSKKYLKSHDGEREKMVQPQIKPVSNSRRLDNWISSTSKSINEQDNNNEGRPIEQGPEKKSSSKKKEKENVVVKAEETGDEYHPLTILSSQNVEEDEESSVGYQRQNEVESSQDYRSDIHLPQRSFGSGIPNADAHQNLKEPDAMSSQNEQESQLDQSETLNFYKNGTYFRYEEEFLDYLEEQKNEGDDASEPEKPSQVPSYVESADRSNKSNDADYYTNNVTSFKNNTWGDNSEDQVPALRVASSVPAKARATQKTTKKILNNKKTVDFFKMTDDEFLTYVNKHDWMPQDFIINPLVNDGIGYEYHEVVRGNKKKCQHGVDCQQCEKFYQLAGTGIQAVGPRWGSSDKSQSQDCNNTKPNETAAFSDLNVDDIQPRVRTIRSVNPGLYKTIEISAKEKASRHRNKTGINHVGSPEGFWKADFPSTQEIAEERAATLKKTKEIARNRWVQAVAAAKSGGEKGTYIFRNSDISERFATVEKRKKP